MTSRLLRALLTMSLILVGMTVPAMASADPPPTGSVHTYRATPGDVESERYQLAANGTDVFVAKYSNRNNNRMHVARFASDDLTPTLTITNDAPITSWKVYPERYYPADTVVVSGNTITFDMTENLRYVIVKLNNNDPQIAIINDPTEDPSSIPDPAAPNVVNAADYVTDRTGATDQTSQVAAAIDVLYADPGKDVLYFPDGHYTYAGLEIRNRTKPVSIYVDEGALLKNRVQPAVSSMEPAIGIWDSANVTVSGRGVFDGNGFANYDVGNGGWTRGPDVSHHQGGVMVVRSQNVVFNDTLARDSKQWNWETHTAKNVTFNNIKGLTPYRQSWVDGIDLASGQNITVKGALTLGNDDTFASGHYNPDDLFVDPVLNPDRLNWDTEDSFNITVKNTLGWSTLANSIRLGHSAYGHQMRDYTFDNFNTVGFEYGGGGISVQNSPDSGVRNYPRYQNITIRNSSFDTTNSERNFSILGKKSALDSDRIATVVLEDSWFTTEKPALVQNVSDLSIKNLHVAGQKVIRLTQTALTFDNVIQRSLDFPEDVAPVIDPIPAQEVNFGQQLSVTVTASDGDGDATTLSVGTGGLPAGAQFDPASGVLTWTPTPDQLGKHQVVFVVTDARGATGSAIATIKVNDPDAETVELTAVADTGVQTWNAEQSLNYGDNEHLRMLNFNDAALGALGQVYPGGQSSKDAKLTYLRFDLAGAADEFAGQELLGAELKLTYFGPTKVGLTGTNTLKVAAAAPGWIEGNGKTTPTVRTNTVTGAMTWLTKAGVTAGTVVESAPFDVTTPAKVGADSTYAASQKPIGTVASTNVTDLVKSVAASGQVDLAVNETKRQDIIFVSREGAARNPNAAGMAPTLVLTFAAPPDTTAPTVTAVTDPATPDGADGWFVGPATVTATAADDRQVASIEFRTDPTATWAAYTGPIAAPEGSTAYEFRATDVAGNVSPVVAVPVKRDVVAPAVTATVSADRAVTIAATDAGSGIGSVEYRIDTGDWTAYVAPVVAPDAAAHTVTFRATDRAGLVSEAGTVEVPAAVTAPVLAFRTPAENATVQGTVPVTVALSGANLQAYNLRIDSTGLQYVWQPTAGDQTFQLNTTTLGDGVHTLLATATNTAGQKTTITSKITVANTPATTKATGKPGAPVLSNNNGWDTGLKDNDYTVTMNMWWGNNGTTFKLYENGTLISSQYLTDNSPSAQSAKVDISGKPNGTYRYTCELTNAFGTTSCAEHVVTVTDAAPGKPGLSTFGSGADRKINANMWWGTNGTRYELYRNGIKIYETDLTAKTPAAQTVAFTIGTQSGSYVGKLTNAYGTTESAALTVQ